MDPDDLATVSPLITRTLRRFGDRHLDLSPPMDVVATRLDLPRSAVPDHAGVTPRRPG
ncbi:hypothetical protein AB0B54_14815 [Microbispora bryophytorum]|uniref:hypothetical protein n=1 Tax=Microbispora bryophytorum TaxID=1460882 RepID=UPI0033F1A837